MNPLPFILLAISLPLLLGGCGEKEPVGEVKPVEEKVLEVKEEVKTEEPIAEVQPELEGVNRDELERRKDIVYLKGSDTPYTGKSFELYKDGQKQNESNYKDGKEDGLYLGWYESGQKSSEANYKDGKLDGLTTGWYENGQKKIEANYKDGKMYGLQVMWHENGQKEVEGNWKGGKLISIKAWNSKGELIRGEAQK